MYEIAAAVQRMQDYIEIHLCEEITLEALADAAGYTHSHASRLFKQQVGLNPFEYIRARRLSQAVMTLRDTSERILDIALSFGFDSHEGFSRAFSGHFGISPYRYRRETPVLELFMPRSALSTYRYKNKEEIYMQSQIVFTQVVERPNRKLLLIRGKKSTHYFEFCEEVGCDTWGKLLSVRDALYEPVGMWMPDNLRTPGTSIYTQGVEMPAEYEGPVPEGMELIELPACYYMVFQSQPYPDEQMEEVIDQVQKAMEAYDPRVYNWEWADSEGPRIQLAPIGERGYIEARPVRAIIK